MGRYLFPLLALTAVAVSACAPVKPGNSFVQGVTPEDSRDLAAEIVGYVSEGLPAARSTVMLDAVSSDQLKNPLTPALTSSLATAGYSVATPPQPANLAHRIAYRVSPMDGGFLLRLRIDGRESTRFYVRDTAGHLVGVGPFIVREGA
jgi:hypothetical protein